MSLKNKIKEVKNINRFIKDLEGKLSELEDRSSIPKLAAKMEANGIIQRLRKSKQSYISERNKILESSKILRLLTKIGIL